jgi:hypothetical protein
MDEKVNLQIEDAKTWFALAQILIILAGFMFASAGISLTNSINLIKSEIDIVNKAVEISDNSINNAKSIVENFVPTLDKLQKEQINSFKRDSYTGVGLIVLSLFFWGLGKYKINKIIKKNP